MATDSRIAIISEIQYDSMTLRRTFLLGDIPFPTILHVAGNAVYAWSYDNLFI